MEVWYAAKQYKSLRGMPQYELFQHQAIGTRHGPFKMQMPSIFLPWNEPESMIAFSRTDKVVASCRCGVVMKGIFFQLTNSVDQVSVALKVMDKRQIQLQSDDIEQEIRIMSQLQPAGINAPLSNPYLIRWEYGEDEHNQYIATEYVSNESLFSYATKKIHQLMVREGD